MPGIVAAMVSKNVDGGVVSPPTTVKANDAGFPMVASAIAEKVPLQNNLTAVLKSYADAHPDVVTAYLKAELEAEVMMLKQPDVTIKTVAKHTQSDDSAAKIAYEAMLPAIDKVGLVTEPGLKTIQDFGPNPATKNVTLSGAYDNSFLQKIKDSGFYDQIGLK
jgi:ABC-type nitrate/sulfonate/bicarbonate transport system substrate-binding protein